SPRGLRRCSRHVAVRDGEWRVMRLELAEHLVDAVASFLADEGVPALVTGVRDMNAGSTTGERTTVEAHVPAKRAPALLRALEQWLASLAQIEPAAGRVRITADILPPLAWEAPVRPHHPPPPVRDRLLVAAPWGA